MYLFTQKFQFLLKLEVGHLKLHSIKFTFMLYATVIPWIFWVIQAI